LLSPDPQAVKVIYLCNLNLLSLLHFSTLAITHLTDTIICISQAVSQQIA